jgi:hypothetical protein
MYNFLFCEKTKAVERRDTSKPFDRAPIPKLGIQPVGVSDLKGLSRTKLPKLG